MRQRARVGLLPVRSRTTVQGGIPSWQLSAGRLAARDAGGGSIRVARGDNRTR